MFEMLMLASFVLIIASQFLPETTEPTTKEDPPLEVKSDWQRTSLGRRPAWQSDRVNWRKTEQPQWIESTRAVYSESI